MNAVIIGAGASGIACAIRIKQMLPTCSVTVLEHLESPCKKIYATGNGRCNITNENAEGYVITKNFLESIGLVLRTGGEGRVYPYSNQASSVVKVLLNACELYNVKIINNCEVFALERNDERFKISSRIDKVKTKYFYADIAVLATGGQAQKNLGSDGSGYALAKMAGHSTTPLSPALVQLESSSKNCRLLKGVRVKCKVSIDINNEIVDSSYGELLFADYGISGIVTMDLSKNISDLRIKQGKDRCTALIDFVPSMSKEELLYHIDNFGSLDGVLPLKLCSILEKQTNGDHEKIASYAKNWRVIITGTKGYSFAQITSGGVPLNELDENGKSLITDNLFIIGELADRQFKCGGYNLDNAISSGVKAAGEIAKIKKKS